MTGVTAVPSETSSCHTGKLPSDTLTWTKAQALIISLTELDTSWNAYLQGQNLCENERTKGQVVQHEKG